MFSLQYCSSPSPATSGRRTKGMIFSVSPSVSFLLSFLFYSFISFSYSLPVFLLNIIPLFLIFLPLLRSFLPRFFPFSPSPYFPFFMHYFCLLIFPTCFKLLLSGSSCHSSLVSFSPIFTWTTLFLFCFFPTVLIPSLCSLLGWSTSTPAW